MGRKTKRSAGERVWIVDFSRLRDAIRRGEKLDGVYDLSDDKETRAASRPRRRKK